MVCFCRGEECGGYVLLFMTATVWGRKTTAPYLRDMSCTDMRFCLMWGFSIAGTVKILFLFVLICMVPVYAADDVEDVAALVVTRVLMGCMVSVAFVMCVGLAPESRMYVIPW